MTDRGAGEVVNLRRARKQRDRANAQREAAANRLAFGVSKSAQNKSEAERALEKRRLDGSLRLERDDGA